MTTDQASDHHPERRAADAMPAHFPAEALNASLLAHPAFADAQIEAIDMDVALPPGHHGHDDQFPAETTARTPTPIDKEQHKARLEIAKFKGTLDDFEVWPVTQVNISNIKRGDVIEIRTIVGSIFFRVIDRIKGLAAGAGEVLCECRYDLQNQWTLIHAASIILPVCTKNHVITNPDGSQRMASRALKMTANVELPDQVRNLLRENFFVEMKIYATPQKERLRPIDVVRGLQRMALKLKGAGK